MKQILHITSGDTVGDLLRHSGLAGDIFVWHDILYEGPRSPGWPDDETLKLRAHFLVNFSGGGLGFDQVLTTLGSQYARLKECDSYEHVVLWFDGCLFDQSMLVHILACLSHLAFANVELICINSFPGIEPFHGLGQLSAAQLASLFGQRVAVTQKHYDFAVKADVAFASDEPAELSAISQMHSDVLPYLPAAMDRLIQEMPHSRTALGRLEKLIMSAAASGCETPATLFNFVAAREPPPQYWGDTTLWAKINGLAEREPPLLKIEGPAPRLPQWSGSLNLNEFKISVLPEN